MHVVQKIKGVRGEEYNYFQQDSFD